MTFMHFVWLCLGGNPTLILEARQRLPTSEIQSIARTKELTFRYHETVGVCAIGPKIWLQQNKTTPKLNINAGHCLWRVEHFSQQAKQTRLDWNLKIKCRKGTSKTAKEEYLQKFDHLKEWKWEINRCILSMPLDERFIMTFLNRFLLAYINSAQVRYEQQTNSYSPGCTNIWSLLKMERSVHKGNRPDRTVYNEGKKESILK